jgi:hypothetical protein
VLTLLAVLALRKGAGRPLAALAGVGASVATFLVTTPGIWADSERFWRDTAFEMQHTSTGHGLAFTGTSPGYVYHFGTLMLGIGPILTLLAIGGLAFAAWTREKWAFAVLAFAIPYYLLIGHAEVKFMRYTFPMFVVLALGLGWLAGKMRERGGWGHLLVGLAILGLGGLDSGGLNGSARFLYRMATPEMRDVSADVLKGIAKTRPTVVGLTKDPWFYTPSLYPDTALTLMVPFPTRDQLMRAARNPSVERFIPKGPNGELLYDQRVEYWDTRLITESKPDFVVFSSFETADVERMKDLLGLPPNAQSVVQQYRDFAKELQARYNLTAQYGDGRAYVEDMMYVMPTVFVWKRKDLP